MNKFLVSTIITLSFTGFVTYATMQTIPQKEEQVEVKEEAIQEKLNTTEDSIVTTQSIPNTTKIAVTNETLPEVAPLIAPVPATITDTYISKSKDKLTDTLHYEDDDDDESEEEDD